MPGNGQVTLNWSPPSTNGGAAITSYQVSRDNGFTWVTVSGGANARSHTFTGLANGTAHTFRVRAVNSVGFGAQAAVMAVPVGLPTLTASFTNLTSTTVMLHGNITNAGGAPITARGFWIRPAHSPHEQEWLVPVTSNSFSWTITGLTPNTQYVARAIARNNGSVGTGQSAQMVFTTPAIINTPSAPQHFNAMPGNGQVTLNWSTPLTNGGAAITSYQVSRDNGSTWVTVAGGANARSHTFTGLANGVAHTFRVRAVNSAGFGAQAAVMATPFGNPTLTGSFSNLTSTSVTLNGTITNTGGAPITARGFWIREATSTQEQEWLVHTTANSFSATVTGLRPNTQYVARAIARNGSVGTGQSAQMAFTTPPAPTPAPTLTLTPTLWNPQATASSNNFTITTNQPITNVSISISPSTASSWLSVTGTGTTRTMTVAANPNTTARTANINVTATGAGGAAPITRTITVTQAANAPTPTLTLNRTAWQAFGTAHAESFMITTNQPLANVQVSISPPQATNWLSVTGTGTLRTMVIDANLTTITRTATITVSLPSIGGAAPIVRSINVTQRPLLSSSEWQAPPEGGTYTIIVNSNEPIRSITSNEAWVRGEIINNTTIRLIADANAGGIGSNYDGLSPFTIEDDYGIISHNNLASSSPRGAEVEITINGQSLTFNVGQGSTGISVYPRASWSPSWQAGQSTFTLTPSVPHSSFRIDIPPALRSFVSYTRTGNTLRLEIDQNHTPNPRPFEHQDNAIAIRALNMAGQVVATGSITVRQGIDPFYEFYGGLGWIWPIEDPAMREISSGYYRYRPAPWNDFHVGIDVVNQVSGQTIGHPVMAAHDGFVIGAERIGGGGYSVALRSQTRDPITNDFIVTRYMHMTWDENVRRPTVSETTLVHAGTPIGLVGYSGLGGPGAAHLHFDVNANNMGLRDGSIRRYARNPFRFFPFETFTTVRHSSGNICRTMP